MGKHILVIDDNRLILQIAGDILAGAGYRVSTAEDVLYCNDIIYSKAPPDLIIMDVNLPFMTGDHKVRIMKGRPRGREIPILLLSSASEDELQTLAAACGADGFLAKPLDDKVLLATVGAVLASGAATA
jgi:CheY-like chemotaxis protein